MDNVELFERLGLAIAIGAAVGVERHWRERDEPEGARTAGIRTFTMFGMAGGVAGLLERSIGIASGYPGITLTGFLIAIATVMAIFEIREAIAEKSFSVTSVVAAILTFGLGALAVLGDMALASAGGAALIGILVSREFLHQAIRRLQWVELRSAVILLAMTFVLLPIIPEAPLGPFGGVSPKSIVLLVIMLASISFVGYVAVRLFGARRGDVLAGAVGGLVSSTATTVSFARRSRTEDAALTLAAGAISAGAVSLLRTALLVATLAGTLLPVLLAPLLTAASLLVVYALSLAQRQQAAGTQGVPGNPFELAAVAKMALLLAAVAFLARAATQQFGSGGLIVASALSALADVDAATVTVAGLLPSLDVNLAAQAIGVAVVCNMVAKAVYAGIFGSLRFLLHLTAATVLSVGAGLIVWGLGVAA
ncbi:MAG: MgtC/SapB family protein [Rhizobium sp.]|nr:MgtC/SapB family protein [Rhizobium sp.]